MNTLMFSLHKNIGSTIAVPDDDHPQHQLIVKGMFQDSIFQGVLVMSEQNFLRLFPEQKGFRYFLIEVPRDQAEAASAFLETELAEYGFDAEPVSERLARFLSVQNTYLSTFQTLGGLGLLLGTFGLAAVMMRNVLERQSELALLRAVGFRERSVACGKTRLSSCGVWSRVRARPCLQHPPTCLVGARISRGDRSRRYWQSFSLRGCLRRFSRFARRSDCPS